MPAIASQPAISTLTGDQSAATGRPVITRIATSSKLRESQIIAFGMAMLPAPDPPANRFHPMNLNALTNHMMLNVSARWLESADFVDTLKSAGPLGLGVLGQLEKAHAPLAELENRRFAAESSLRSLMDRAAALDSTHDRKARALNYHLHALIEGSDDPKRAADYREIEALLFPRGLRVIQLPYIEEGGAAVALDRAVDAEARARLAAIGVGDQTLLTLFEAWMKAGHQLGEVVSARAQLQIEIIRERGGAGVLDIKACRARWMQAVRGLVWAVEADEGIAVLADRVLAPLELAARGAVERRAGDEDGDGLDDEIEGVVADRDGEPAVEQAAELATGS
jgi:hypothetical protein